MGDVYRARDLRLGRQVAIKFVSPRLYGNADAEARLDREARTASASITPPSSRSTTSAVTRTDRTW